MFEAPTTTMSHQALTGTARSSRTKNLSTAGANTETEVTVGVEEELGN
jgi:hypothetical protein